MFQSYKKLIFIFLFVLTIHLIYLLKYKICCIHKNHNLKNCNLTLKLIKKELNYIPKMYGI